MFHSSMGVCPAVRNPPITEALPLLVEKEERKRLAERSKSKVADSINILYPGTVPLLSHGRRVGSVIPKREYMSIFAKKVSSPHGNTQHS